jgi:pyruvate dehydrogenase E1 component
VPTCFLAYTIKGYGLPFAAHKDNHAGLMTPAQLDALRVRMNIREGEEWAPFAGLRAPHHDVAAAIANAPFNQPCVRRQSAPRIPVPIQIVAPDGPRMSTQEGFGRLLGNIAREHPELAERIVTTSPDVTISTSLGTWVNRRGVYGRQAPAQADPEQRIASLQKWSLSPGGQHIELGIAESNLFLLLAAMGLSGPLFGSRLLPIGTVYDPFICRGLDALNYACYQDARFILVATPSGLTLAPEGGAHQSIYTPLIGMGQPALTAFEPAHVDELTEILRWSFEHLQEEDGGSVYLRLSTRPIAQPQREMTTELAGAVLEGAYWLVPPGPGAELAIVACGVVVPEAIAAHRQILEDIPEAGLLVVTSPDRLHRGWLRQHGAQGAVSGAISHVERVLADLDPRAGLVTVLDGHPATLSWLGAVAGHTVMPLGVEAFGQSGDIGDLYRVYGLDADAIVGAAARLCLSMWLRSRPS